ncbi:MAG: hypothetical protein FD187_2787 [bacterium]|nr:MAG: hypothetical protein FD142_2743 [bacterium]KAF0147401.1 MAG: hypothetical protein FD187_2787 [bacterium]KAF0167402.1 MAG: hypothetical protein FD158_2306 [bacterium]TXT16266.1 MAG: hypothetical protein FD132_2914 [bacterium]
MKSLIPLLCLAALPAFAADPAPATIPASADALAKQMLDPTRNTAAFKDPQAFMAWANAMANPNTSAALAQMGMDPATYVRMMGGLMNPASMQNYMQFSDPSIAMKWMGAGLDPRMYTQMAGMAANPAMYGNWLQAPLNPQMWSPAMQMMNPGMYGNWMQAPMSPGAMNTMMAPMNPNLYMNWMGAGADPRTYGNWGQMMNAPQMLPAIDPAMLLKLMQAMPAMPAAPAPAK